MENKLVVPVSERTKLLLTLSKQNISNVNEEGNTNTQWVAINKSELSNHEQKNLVTRNGTGTKVTNSTVPSIATNTLTINLESESQFETLSATREGLSHRQYFLTMSHFYLLFRN